MRYVFWVCICLMGLHAAQTEASGRETGAKPAQIVYGKVTQVESVMGYNYLEVDVNGSVQWVAIAEAPVKVGDTIGYDNRTVMKNFKSKRLGRTFSRIVFANEVYLRGKRREPSSLKEMLDVPQESQAAQKAPEKAFYTVEEIHRYKKSLAGKIVSVKARVYKVSRQIMQRDWVHLGDGTGSEKALTDDIVFTSKNAAVKAGDHVVAKARIVTDKDFGYGYFYPVMGEDAVFIKQ